MRTYSTEYKLIPMATNSSTNHSPDQSGANHSADHKATNQGADNKFTNLGTHYYVNLIEAEFAIGIAKSRPWYIKLWLLFWGLLYKFFGRFHITLAI